MIERSSLYTADELLAGFDSGHFIETWDFRCFQRFVADGGPAPTLLDVRKRHALEDAQISHLLMDFLVDGLPLVGIMGGHKLPRDAAAYRAVAELTQVLAKEFTIASGGGPGAMEASHVGAASPDLAALDRVMAKLQAAPSLPRLTNVVDPMGNVIADDKTLKDADAWLAAATSARALLPPKVRESLAIPTWLYGQEPTMPFATAYAKYFHNSIREEALVKQAAAGIVYARGGGGTLREIFQDVEENYYAPSASAFTPMIFFDPDGYWQRTFEPGRDGIRIEEVIREIIAFARKDKDDAAECLAKVVFTTDTDEVLGVLRAHRPVAQRNLEVMVGGGASHLYLASER